jgi:hypothetical protein
MGGHGRRDTATLCRLDDPELTYVFDGAKKIVPQAMQVRDRLRAGTRASQYVQGVVVVWGKFPQRVAGDRCVFVHGDHLVDWLRSRPQRIAPERVGQFSAALQAAASSSDGGRPGSTTARVSP